MSKSQTDSENEVRPGEGEEHPDTTARALGLADRLREAARSIAGKRPAWLKPSRVREAGVRPKSFSVWLGRLRRKKP